MSTLSYPVGRFTVPDKIDSAQRAAWIEDIARAPAALRAAVAGLSPEQLDTPYRPEGWTVRQVVHHVPDSHLNAYCRFKLALTETRPVIKPYDQAAWAVLPDARHTPVDISLTLLEALHVRWVALLRSMDEAEFARGYEHPEMGRFVPLDEVLGTYAWHGRHHVAHITSLRQRSGW